MLPVACLAEDLPKLPPETQELIDQARAAPPEFSADLLLKLAASPLITDAKWKLQLAEEAFAAGGHAQLPYTYYCHVPVDVIQCQERDSKGLDVLALQTRAVETVLPLKPQRAVEMFLSIVPPKVAGVTCADPVTPNVSAYYVTAGTVFERGFTAAQRKEGEDLRFLETCIASMTSPVHVPPLLKMLSTLKLRAEDRAALLGRFAVTLERVAGSDREFGTSEWMVVPTASPETPPGRYLPRPVLPEMPDAALFVPALRALVRQLSGPRCSDRIGEDELPVSASNFNALAAKLDPDGTRIKPIRAEEVKPLRAEHFWLTAQAYSLLARLMPPGSERENAMDRYLNFLETSYAPDRSRVLWFVWVRDMLDHARRTKDAGERKWVLNSLARSRSAVIRLYARIFLVKEPIGSGNQLLGSGMLRAFLGSRRCNASSCDHHVDPLRLRGAGTKPKGNSAAGHRPHLPGHGGAAQHSCA